MNILFIIIADALLAGSFSITKFYQKLRPVSFRNSNFFDVICAVPTIIVYLIMGGFSFKFTPFSFLMCMLQLIAAKLYGIIGYFMVASGSIALYTMFLMTGGMVLPYVFGIFFWNEQFSVLRMLALVLMIVAVIVSNFDGGKINKKLLLMSVAVFVLNGAVSIISKIHQTETRFETVDTAHFALMGAVIGMITSIAIEGYFLLGDKREGRKELISKKVVLRLPILVIVNTLCGVFSNYLLLRGATDIPASVLYPVNTGGTIVFSSVVGILLFKEKLNSKVVISVILCCIGTILFI